MPRRISIALGSIPLVAMLAFYLRYGGHGRPFPPMGTTPVLPETALETVATLPEPPGNLAVSPTGRVFFTYHAESRPKIKVLELVNGRPVPFPDLASQSKFDSIFNVRIDGRNRLWTLDHGFHGLRQPRLLAFDIDTRQQVDQFDFPRDIAGFGSYIQDMQISPDGETIYIADLSAFAGKPALIVYDVRTHTARRMLERNAALMPGDWEINARGHRMYLLGGLYWMHPGFDPIALDRRGEWLYMGAMSSDTLYRAPVSDLNKVEAYAKRSQCDGLSMDDQDDIYVTSIEDGAINIIGPDRKQKTLVKSPKLRWPDGLSFGPNGYLYIADSDIPDVMMRTNSHIAASAPFHIFRLQTGHTARAGQ